MGMKAFITTILACYVLVATSFGASAQTLSEVERLHFGTFVVRNNMSTSSITVTPDNDTIVAGQIVLAENGRRGEYMLTGLPPNVPFYLGVDMPNPPAEGGIVLGNPEPASAGAGADFILNALTIGNGGVMLSDGIGDATVYIGGTLNTTGTGQAYAGGSYIGSYTITIYY